MSRNKTKKQTNLNKKLNKVFYIQLIFISIVTVASVFGAAKVVENVLIKQALIGEADFFWQHYEKDPNFSLPITMNLTGYMVEDDDYSQVPAVLKDVKSNYQRVALSDKLPIVYRTVKDNKELYLVFEESQVSILALYFGIAPLIVVLLAIYLPAFYSYVQSKRAFSPILQVIEKIESVNVNNQELATLSFDSVSVSRDSEVEALVDSFEHFSHRISEFIKRERNFSRYASHELRTPLTVLKGSISILKRHQLSEASLKVIDRMNNMITEMQELIESLLLLSREQDIIISDEKIIVNDLLKDLINKNVNNFADKNIQVKWQFNNLIQGHLPDKLFAIVINNVVRNACAYSHPNSAICVTVEGKSIVIKDSGKGMTKEQLADIFKPFYRADEHSEIKGFGLGLAIVEWICRQCQWDIDFDSIVDQGTTVTLTIKDIEVVA